MLNMKMRNLQLSDIFKMSKILKKMNLTLQVSEDAKPMEMGVQFIQRILENLYMAEDEINAFMADMVGMTTEEFAKLGMEEVVQVFELFKQQKGLTAFFKLAGK